MSVQLLGCSSVCGAFCFSWVALSARSVKVLLPSIPTISVVSRFKGWLKDQSRSGAFLEMWA
jgi:hypothetical protein